ncbi:glycerophosphodiester phosphodiesterase family protein [Arthrobacter sp. Marseille-P9274]|uniref:glycerophosphodiester phosphodiesterase n=1 Tax=Arthrobacter sp. Marseille-P9274 TaxID=2866572 RepID=UPI0021C612BA|nr:glycerophosphodiester phosphodiesterase family protein [Arthrobacter sp. Marseille-P9274]
MALLIPVLAACTPAAADDFTFVAHRGGHEAYPESSQEALAAAAAAGFPVEFDLRQLEDGQWAVAHDAETGKTVVGASGPIDEITTAQWESATITEDGREGHPATWDWVVTQMPENVLLVPELKDPLIAPAKFAQAVKLAGLEDRVVVQSFDFGKAKELAELGLDTLFLTKADSPEKATEIAAAGIAFVGPSNETSESRLRSFHDAGLTVWVWTVNDQASAEALRGGGYVDGVFTDKPVALSGS